jgi:hypothetical protein
MDGLIAVVNAYHKLVKTTPKPRATKNKSGELVGPPDELELVDMADGEDEVCDGAVATGLTVDVWVSSTVRCRSEFSTT